MWSSAGKRERGAGGWEERDCGAGGKWLGEDSPMAGPGRGEPARAVEAG